MKRQNFIAALAAAFALVGFSLAGCGESSADRSSSLGVNDRAGDADGKTDAKADAENPRETEDAPDEKQKTEPTILKPKVVGERVADFTFTERSGKPVGRKDLLGKPWVACFIFTHCAGPCSDVSAQMAKLQEWLKQQKIDDVQLVTFSVDPKRDTTEVLTRYAKNYGADKDRWWLLTGDEKEIYTLIRESFDQEVHQQTGKERVKGWEVLHTSAVILVDEKGRVVEEYNGKYEVSMLQLQQRINRWKKTGSFDDGKDKKPESAESKPDDAVQNDDSTNEPRSDAK